MGNWCNRSNVRSQSWWEHTNEDAERAHTNSTNYVARHLFKLAEHSARRISVPLIGHHNLRVWSTRKNEYFRNLY